MPPFQFPKFTPAARTQAKALAFMTGLACASGHDPTGTYYARLCTALLNRGGAAEEIYPR